MGKANKKRLALTAIGGVSLLASVGLGTFVALEATNKTHALHNANRSRESVGDIYQNPALKNIQKQLREKVDLIKKKEDEIKSNKAKIDELRSRIPENKKEIARLKMTNKMNTLQAWKLLVKIKSLEEKFATETARYLSEKEKLTKSNETLNNRNQQLTLDIANKEKDIQDKNQEITNKKAELLRKEQKYQQDVDALNTQLKDSQEKYQKDTTDLNNVINAKKTEILNKGLEIEKLKLDISTGESLIRQKQSEIDRQLKEISDKNDEITQKNQEIDNRDAEIKANQATIDKKNQEITEKEAEISKNKLDIKNKNDEIDKMKQEIIQKAEEISKQKKILGENTENILALKTLLDVNAEQNKIENAKLMKNFKDNLQIMKDQYEKAVNHLNKDLKTTKEEKTKDEEELDKLNKKINKTIENYKKAVDAVAGVGAALDKAAEKKYNDDMDKFKQEKARLEKDIQDKTNDINNKQRVLDTLKKENEEKDKKIEEMKKDHKSVIQVVTDKYEDALKIIRAELQTSKNDLAAKTKALEDADKAIDSLKLIVEANKNNIEQQNIEHKALLEKLRLATESNANLISTNEKAIAELKKASATLELASTARDALIAENVSKIAHLETLTKNVKTLADQNNASIQTNNTAISDLKARIKAQETLTAINEATIATLKTSIDQEVANREKLRDTLKALIDDNNTNIAELTKAKNNHKQLIDDNATNIATSKTAISDLDTKYKKAVSDINADIATIKTSIATNTTGIEDNKKEILGIKSKATAIKNRVDDLETKHTNDNAARSKEISDLQTETNNLSTTIADMKKIENTLKQKVEAINIWKQANANIGTKVTDLESKNQTLEKEVNTLKSDVATLKSDVVAMKKNIAANKTGIKNNTDSIKQVRSGEYERVGKIDKTKGKLVIPRADFDSHSKEYLIVLIKTSNKQVYDQLTFVYQKFGKSTAHFDGVLGEYDAKQIDGTWIRFKNAHANWVAWIEDGKDPYVEADYIDNNLWRLEVWRKK